MSILPIAVPDLCCAISGDDISSQHLKGRSFSSSVHTQQTKALCGNTVSRSLVNFLSTIKHYGLPH